MRPLVSILIPAYKAAPWLAQTLDSALSQTYLNCEIIVVDDGSPDGTRAIAEKYIRPGLKVVTQPNGGASAARNHALRLARGDFIQFLDADDLLAPDKIQLQMEWFLQHPATQLCSGEWGRFINEPAEATFPETCNQRDLNGVEFLQLFYEQFAMMQPAAWLSRRTLLDKAGRWDESLSLNDDGEYFARVMLLAREIHFCRGAKVYYRSSINGSLSARQDKRAMESLHRSTVLTLNHLLACDRSARTIAAAAYAWKWVAFELYPTSPQLSRDAWHRSLEFGGSSRPFPAGPRFQRLANLVGWRLAKRLRNLL